MGSNAYDRYLALLGREQALLESLQVSARRGSSRDHQDMLARKLRECRNEQREFAYQDSSRRRVVVLRSAYYQKWGKRCPFDRLAG